MLAKLAGALATAKGAAAATVITATVVAGGVTATNEDVRNTVQNVAQNVTQNVTPQARPTECPKPSGSPKPEVVTLRNSADDKLRDAFRNDQVDLEQLRSTKVEPSARERLNDAVKTADERLRARLTRALDDVAALTLGREGRESQPANPSPKGCPDVKASLAPDTSAKLDAIVNTAIADMTGLVNVAKGAVAALPAASPGKPADVPGGKPADLPGAKPPDVPGGKPSDVPRGGPNAPTPTPAP